VALVWERSHADPTDRALRCPAGFWKQLAAALEAHPWGVVPLYLAGQFPVALQREDQLGPHGKTVAEVDECHVTLLLIDRERRRIERYDPYSDCVENDPLLRESGDGSMSGRYDVQGTGGLEATLERQCRAGLADLAGAEWTYVPARQLCGDSCSTARGSVGPQDLEERIEVGFTRPTDGLGFCAAWCFFLAECRILNPEVESAELVARVVGQLAKRPSEGWWELPQEEALREFSEMDVARVYLRGRGYAMEIVEHRDEVGGCCVEEVIKPRDDAEAVGARLLQVERAAAPRKVCENPFAVTTFATSHASMPVPTKLAAL
jgi:hypothetical protein